MQFHPYRAFKRWIERNVLSVIDYFQALDDKKRPPLTAVVALLLLPLYALGRLLEFWKINKTSNNWSTLLMASIATLIVGYGIWLVSLIVGKEAYLAAKGDTETFGKWDRVAGSLLAVAAFALTVGATAGLLTASYFLARALDLTVGGAVAEVIVASFIILAPIAMSFTGVCIIGDKYNNMKKNLAEKGNTNFKKNGDENTLIGNLVYKKQPQPKETMPLLATSATKETEISVITSSETLQQQIMAHRLKELMKVGGFSDSAETLVALIDRVEKSTPQSGDGELLKNYYDNCSFNFDKQVDKYALEKNAVTENSYFVSYNKQRIGTIPEFQVTQSHQLTIN